jgi:GNAT superfamily N-acetyltransferase
MFCSPALAARIDRAEGRLCAALANGVADPASLVLPLAGGLAIYAGPDSPTNKVIGVGFDGPVSENDFAQLEAKFAQRNARIQAEISTLADVSVHPTLCSRGYVPSGFENVLGHPLQAIAPAPEGISVQIAAPAEFPAFADVMVESFAHPDIGGVGGDAIPPSEEIRKWVLLTLKLPGFRAYLARIDGEIAGGASLRIDDRVAQFSGAGTLPRFRRRGVQTALLRTRLAEAAREGCDIAVVVTQPASKSQENVQREGFSLLYSRQLLVKAAPATKPFGQTAAL